MNRLTMIPSILLATAGCYAVSLQQLSSGHVGCQPEEIRISDERGAPSGWRGWKATCGGVVYICSAAGHDVACHPESERETSL
jgi:hypothetical protein